MSEREARVNPPSAHWPFYQTTILTQEEIDALTTTRIRGPWECRYCGSLNKPENDYCFHCGAPHKAPRPTDLMANAEVMADRNLGTLGYLSGARQPYVGLYSEVFE